MQVKEAQLTANQLAADIKLMEQLATADVANEDDKHEHMMRYMERELANNVAMSRMELLRNFLDPRRDIDDECGYPKSEQLTSKFYTLLYDREAIAARVVEIWPDETWQVSPTIVEDEDPDRDTPFEMAFKSLAKSLRGPSWYMDDEQHPVWEYLRRADILSGIGHYGVLLLGIDDGKELSEPVEGINERGEPVGELAAEETPRKLTFLRVFDEALAEITRWEKDPTNPRFGQPVTYKLTFNDPNERQGGQGLTLATLDVHWTRVIHLADNLKNSEVFGIPRIRPVYNRLYDLRKMYGGAAEMYWKGAFMGMSFETHPSLGGDVTVDEASIRTAIEDYQNKLQRFLLAKGGSWKSIAPQVSDPTPQIKSLIESICVKLGCPMRIFLGSERGELASTQDESAWLGRVMARQLNYVTPRVIVPFIDRLILMRVLPAPGGNIVPSAETVDDETTGAGMGYIVKWPDLDALSEDETAGIAVKRTEAFSKYVGGNVESLVPPMEYLTLVHGYSQAEAEQIIEAAVQAEAESTQLTMGDDEDEEVTDEFPPNQEEDDAEGTDAGSEEDE